MRRLTIVISDAEQDYVSGISEYLFINHGLMFKIHQYSQRDLLESFLEDSKEKIDILLVSSDYYYPQLEQLKIGLIVVVREDFEQQFSDGVFCIRKYQPVSNLLNEIIRAYSKRCGREIVLRGKREAKIFAFYSPAGGVGVSTIAVSAAMIAARAGKRVCYVNFEQVSSTKLFFDCDKSVNLSNLFYYTKAQFREAELNACENLDVTTSLAKNEDAILGIRYFSPHDCVFEVFDLQEDEFCEFLNNPGLHANEDIIIVDIGTNVRPAIFSALKECDKIFVVRNDDVIAKYKYDIFSNDIKMIENESSLALLSKITCVNNLVKMNANEGTRGKIKGNLTETPREKAKEKVKVKANEVILDIPYVENLLIKHKNTLVPSLDNEFGEAIRNIVRIMEEIS